MNGVDPQVWFADVLARTAAHPAHRIDELLPWTWKALREAAPVRLIDHRAPRSGGQEGSMAGSRGAWLCRAPRMRRLDARRKRHLPRRSHRLDLLPIGKRLSTQDEAPGDDLRGVRRGRRCLVLVSRPGQRAGERLGAVPPG